MRWLWMVGVVFLALLMSSASVPAMPAPDPGQRGPFPIGSYSITTTNPDTGSTIEAVIYYPASDGAIDPSGAPYAAVVFAHGFMASPSSYPGNAEHLASWGYIVALPDLPDNATEVRQSDARHMFSYLESANGDASSPLHGMVDLARMGVTGHSLGGLSTMIVAARDPRVRAAVALDPTNAHTIIGAEPWDYAAEAPSTTAPLLALGAPSQLCNAEAGYNAMYDSVGSAHRTKLVVAEASHCDFMDTNSQLHIFGCTMFCGGSYDEARVTLIERYTTAWFNYYLRGETGYYDYLYGPEVEEDVSEGRLSERATRSSTRGVSAVAEGASIRVGWTPTDYPIIAGYNVYRSTTSGQYPAQPCAQLGRDSSSFLDTDVVAGERYYYCVRSRDAAGNVHQASSEVSAVAEQAATPTTTSLPSATPTETEDIPAAPTITQPPPIEPTTTAQPPEEPTATPRPPFEEKSRAYLPLLGHE